MIKSSLLQSSNSTAVFTSNEPIIVAKAHQYGHIVYTWNTRFITLLNTFFLGTSITALTKNSFDPLNKFVLFANGNLASTDLDFDMISQYNDYLATF